MATDYLGIDVGTSFIKGGVLDIDGNQLAAIERVPTPAPLPAKRIGWCELQAEQFVTATRELIERLLKTIDQCAGILLCGQMGGLIQCDRGGEALTSYISWVDTRATLGQSPGGPSYFSELLKIVTSEGESRLGNELRPGRPLPFLVWCRENDQLIEGAVPVGLPDFVAARLCGASPVIEWTNATSMLDVTAREWPRDIFAALQLDRLAWPPLVDFRHCVGNFVRGKQTIPVYAAVGDHQCALAGSLLGQDELSINIATGAQVAMLIGTPEPGDYQLRPYFDGLFLKTITNIPAGRALTALLNLFTEIPSAEQIDVPDPWAYAFAAAATVAEPEIAANLAFFPSVVPGPGGLSRLTESNLTVGHVFRAALEQMAEYFRQSSSQLSPTHAWSNLVFSGGIAQRSELLRALICRKLGTAHRIAAATEDTLLGLLVLARVIGGRDKTVNDACEAVRATLP